jgi:hypothetical protein
MFEINLKKRNLASLILIGLLFQVFFPQNINASTGSSLSNVESYQHKKELVNKFNGQFNYTIPAVVIPGPFGSGYTINLNYTSGAKPDDQASWVGAGWNLGAGKIIRQKKGLPDDYRNTKVKYWKKFRKQTVLTEIDKGNLEVGGIDLGGDNSLNSGFGLLVNYTYDNLSGFNKSISLNLNASTSGKGDYSNLNAGGGLGWDLKGNKYYDFDPVKTLLNNVAAMTANNIDFGAGLGASLAEIGFRVGGRAYTNLLTGLYHNNTNSNNEMVTFPSSGIEYQGEVKSQYPSISAWTTVGIRVGDTGGELDINASKLYERKPLPQPIIKNTYGFMYSGDILTDDDVMDYMVEKETIIDPRDKYISIPFSNADNFIILDNNVNGAFRIFQSKLGSFRPNRVASTLNHKLWGVNIGPIIVPLGASLGGDKGNGKDKLIVHGIFDTEARQKNWYNFLSSESNIRNEIPPFSFRMLNDLGHFTSNYPNTLDKESQHTPNAAALKANHNGIRNSFDKIGDPLSDSEYNLDWTIPVNQSTYIDFNTYSDNKYDLNKLSSFSYISPKDLSQPNQKSISEFKVINNAGSKHIYGLPVLSKNETVLSYNVNEISNSPENPPYTHDNKRVYFNISTEKDSQKGDSEPDVIIGHQMEAPYANSYLLTEIYTSNYVDLKNDGPTVDDIGGYTLFDYEQTSGNETGDWYKWRFPYTGLEYSKGSHSDPFDDMASFVSGEKEINYLNTVATKTHVAFFVTNKSNISYRDINTDEIVATESPDVDRLDGYPALIDEYQASGLDLQVESNTFMTQNNPLRFLDRIELWTLDEDQPTETVEISGEDVEIYRVKKKLQTTHFQYDHSYPIWTNSPNSGRKPESTLNYGKLTLSKVWVETGDEVSQYQSPYEFSYEGYEYDYPENVENIYTSGSYSFYQNPKYNYLDIDPWGNYRPNFINSEHRYQNLKFNISQNRNHYENIIGDGDQYSVNYHKYDPSAYQLKMIKLPSRGELHIGYEENEYAYVQDKEAMTFVTPKNVNPSERKIYIDINEELGIQQSDTEKRDQFLQIMQNKFVLSDEFMYFDFFYSMEGDRSVKGELNSYTDEHISGYNKIDDCEYSISDPDLLVITFSDEDGFIPTELCRQFYFNKRYDNINSQGTANPLNGPHGKTTIEYEDQFKDLGDNVEFNAAFSDAKRSKYCNTINEKYSFLRIPLPSNHPKLGGGVRVKYLYTLDKFLADSKNQTYLDSDEDFQRDFRIYGTEYLYTHKDGSSSGVAANEPSGKIRNENALVTVSDKRDPGINSDIVKKKDGVKTISPDQIVQHSFPLGESILPGPSIGYSSVLSRSIFNTESNPGISHNQYFTYKDYPLTRINSLEDTEVKTGVKVTNFNTNTLWTNNPNKSDFDIDESASLLSSGLGTSLIELISESSGNTPVSLSINNTEENNKISLSQGFQFIHHNMNGKPRSHTTYGGNFDEDPDNWKTSKETTFEYYKTGEKIPILNEDLKTSELYLGRDIDITMEDRYVRKDLLVKKKDADVKVIFTLPFLAGGNASISSNRNIFELRMNSISKIISYPGVIKSVTTKIDGIESTKEIKAFDKYSGKPLITNTENSRAEHTGSTKSINKYQTVNLPAWFQHPEFGQKADAITSSIETMQQYYYLQDDDIYFDHIVGLQRKKYSYESEDLYILTIDEFWDNDIRLSKFKRLVPGTIIRVRPNGKNQLYSNTDEYYRVTFLGRHHATLLPLFDAEDIDIPYSIAPCEIEIIQTGKLNALGSSIGQVVKLPDESTPNKFGEVLNIDDIEILETATTFSKTESRKEKEGIAEAINDTFLEILNSLDDPGDTPDSNGEVEYNTSGSWTISLNGEKVLFPVYLNSTTVTQEENKYFVDFGGLEDIDSLKIYDIDGEVKLLNQQDKLDNKIWFSDMYIYRDDSDSEEFKSLVNLNSEYNNLDWDCAACSGSYLVARFNINIERLSAQGNIVTSSTYHPMTSQLNAIFDRAYSLDITDILLNEGYDIERQLDEENFEEVTLDTETKLSFNNFNISGSKAHKAKVNRIWERINEITGLKQFLNSSLYIDSSNGIGSYTRFNLAEPGLGYSFDNSGNLEYFIIKDSEDEVRAYLSDYYITSDNGGVDIGFENRRYEGSGSQFNFLVDICGTSEQTGSIDVISDHVNNNISDIINPNQFTDNYKFELNGNRIAIYNVASNSSSTLHSQNIYPNTIESDVLSILCRVVLPQTVSNPVVPNLGSYSDYDFFTIDGGDLVFDPPDYDISSIISFNPVNNDTEPRLLMGGESAVTSKLLFDFYPKNKDIYKFENVISAKATEYTDEWEIISEKNIESFNENDPYRKGEKGHWGSKESLVYSNPKKSATHIDFQNTTHNLTLNTTKSNPTLSYQKRGTSNYYNEVNDFILYDGDVPSINDSRRWKSINQINSKNADGISTDIKNILGINSAIKLNDRSTQIDILGQRTSSKELLFESFENYEDSQTTEYPELVHTGNKSLNVTSSLQQIGELTLSDNEYELCFWADKGTITDLVIQITDGQTPLVPTGQASPIQVDDWYLHKIYYDGPLTSNSFSINVNAINSGEYVIDDLRVAPKKAVVQSFVYDEMDYKVLAVLDNDHFSNQYIYSPDLSLIKEVSETFKGNKTLYELYQNIPEKLVEKDYNNIEYLVNPQIQSGITNKQNSLNGSSYKGPQKRYYRLNPETKSNNMESDFEFLDLKIDRDGVKIKTIKDHLKDFDKGIDPNINDKLDSLNEKRKDIKINGYKKQKIDSLKFNSDRRYNLKLPSDSLYFPDSTKVMEKMESQLENKSIEVERRSK